MGLSQGIEDGEFSIYFLIFRQDMAHHKYHNGEEEIYNMMRTISVSLCKGVDDIRGRGQGEEDKTDIS